MKIAIKYGREPYPESPNRATDTGNREESRAESTTESFSGPERTLGLNTRLDLEVHHFCGFWYWGSIAWCLYS